MKHIKTLLKRKFDIHQRNSNFSLKIVKTYEKVDVR